jgi:hypothetical protein
MRRRPRNRTVTECHPILVTETRKDGTTGYIKIYIHVDRESSDGVSVGPVVGVRITPKNKELIGSLFEEVMHRASELISREVQTVSVNKALQGRA